MTEILLGAVTIALLIVAYALFSIRDTLITIAAKIEDGSRETRGIAATLGSIGDTLDEWKGK